MKQLALLSESSSDVVVGVDEVGRGPLVGNVVAAAVVLPANHGLSLRDSKKLSARQRAQLEVYIKQTALAWSVGEARPEEIDALNILQATLLAMQRAVAGIGIPFDKILVDGNRCPTFSCPCEAVVKGDSKIDEIAAASILAKVTRDRQMMVLDKRYPAYGFARHKGYPTKAHLEKLAQLGVIEGIYRTSFKPVRQLLQH